MRVGFGTSRRIRLVVAAASLVVICSVAYVLRQTLEAPPDLDDAAPDAVVPTLGVDAAGPASGPPGPGAAEPTGRDGVPAATDRPAPPDGHTYAGHRGEMTVGGRVARAARDVGTLPTWLAGPEALDALVASAASAQREWTFGYVRLGSPSAREDLDRTLDRLGGFAVGSSGALVRARLPGDRAALEALVASPEVAGLGAVPLEVKLAGFGEDGPVGSRSGAPLPVFVTLMEDDRDRSWVRELEARGATVGDYDHDTRAYTATAYPEAIRALAGLDVVAAVEPVREVRALNDTAVPAMGADAVRMGTGSSGLFSGVAGETVPVGVMDTGLNLNHPDIRTNRESVCGAYFPTFLDDEDDRIEEEDLWIDAALHGTHVTGTILGNGAEDPRFAGMAPGVRHIRFAKVLHRWGFGSGEMTRRGMDWLARESACGGAAAMPLVVNMSLSGSSRYWAGRSAGERKLDATVWGHGQLYVVAQGNEGEYSFSDYGAAKNSLAVAAIHDTGDGATFTSVGPTADGRLAPQVAATGVHVNSARGGGSPGGYERFDGTSMAAPAVAGVAALLMDAAPVHKGNPALARARLMASAIRPDAWLEDPAAFPLDNGSGPGALQSVYGLGKVSARTAVLQRNRADGWRSGSATFQPEDGEYGFVDIEVPAGASRLDLVMTWDEPPADTIASSVLNDLDLWLDRDGDCGEAECGERSSRSRIDNVEWIVVRDPEPGTYRAKVAARAVYTAAPRAALAWTVIRGPSTPQLRVDVHPAELGAGQTRDVRVSVSVDGYVAAGTRLHIDCRGPDGSVLCGDSRVESAELSANGDVWREPDVHGTGWRRPSHGVPEFGEWFSLGEVAAGDDREVRLRVRAGTDPARLRVSADAWNARAAVAWVEIGDSPPEAAAIDNDRFADAERIGGTEGRVGLDLFAATPETGEPGVADDPFVRRPASSAWYRWTAPSTEVFHFTVARADGRLSRHARVDVFEGDSIVSLGEASGDRFNVSFQARAGRAYRIRVASLERSENLQLRWFFGRPANDDFVDAEELDGASGTVSESNVGATLEAGESWGDLLGTTWFRWTAPDDGFWAFKVRRHYEDWSPVGDLAVLVFAGERLDALRLVSGVQAGYGSAFPVRSGAEYRIAVATKPAIKASAFELGWQASGRTEGNDAFADAEALPGGTSSAADVHVDYESTVEPDEPDETGVRTRWWKWEAPEDGRFTWRLSIRDDGGKERQLQVQAFAGAALQDLAPIGRAGPLAPLEFVTDAVAGDIVHFAAGFPAGGTDAFTVSDASGELSWGATPDNDGLAGAVLLDTAHGTVSGSNRFATTEVGVRLDLVGRSAVWWTFEAPEDGWYRFSADRDGGPWAVTVFDGDGNDVRASSRWQRSEDAVLFYAEAGSRHAVALGARAGGLAGDFTLRWGTAEAPLWLRYAGRLADGGRDSNGVPVEIRMPAEIAFGGEALYLASDLGLSVFERDAENGELAFVQLVEADLARSSVVWDAERSRVLAHGCGTWRAFERVGDGPSVAAPEELVVAGHPADCGRLLLHPDGAFVYRLTSAASGCSRWTEKAICGSPTGTTHPR